MNKKVRVIVSGFVLLVLLLSLGACSSKSSSGSAGGKNEIVFWNPFTGPDGKNMKMMVDAYNKTNPKYKVKNISLAEGDMYAKIPTVVNSKRNIPDLNIVHAERIKQFVDKDMLVPMDDYLSKYPDIKAENYIKSGWDIGSLNNKRYSVPLDVHSFVMYYNKDLVKKYAPNALDDNIVTYDEIKAAGAKAKKDKIIAMPVTWMKPTFLSVYSQMGGSITSDGTKPTLDTDKAADTLKLYNDLVKSGITNKDGQDAGQTFKSGKAIFYAEGIWMQNDVKSAKNLNWGMTNFPQLSDDKNKMVNWSSSHQFVLLKNPERDKKKTEGIMKFIDWVKDNSLPWAEAGQNPAALATLDNPDYQKMPQSFLVKDATEQKSLKIFDYKYNGYVSEQLDKIGNDTVFGKLDIHKALKSAQKTVEDKIAQDK
ncbi:extracellular solute-binding protein [Fictibacillus fluitans]|uniref:Extracellular solute-binding protein n=1 Tax=Fictibacillus fluitans TaxID=3058422 RepID=A0ABT8HYR8_9BACL|nr:extracellular solute-binding protein [Fictibacillus sp. NE201]MDN4525933.1 extracellular solute-binding protein [Fictibacillus sp. NE201]